jgi:hypothetical protein
VQACRVIVVDCEKGLRRDDAQTQSAKQKSGNHELEGSVRSVLKAGQVETVAEVHEYRCCQEWRSCKLVGNCLYQDVLVVVWSGQWSETPSQHERVTVRDLCWGQGAEGEWELEWRVN